MTHDSRSEEASVDADPLHERPGVEATSASQAEAWSAAELPRVEEVSPGIWALPVPIPAGSIPHTLCYALIGADGVHLIDPGWDTADNLARVSRALTGIGSGIDQVRSVIATHFHPDHLGLAGALRRRSGAAVMMSAAERRVLAAETAPGSHDVTEYRGELARWGVPSERQAELVAGFDRPSLVADLEADRLLVDGDVLRIAGRTLEVIATPGHSGGHICLADRAARILFSGDHVLPQIYSGVGIGALAGSEPLADLFSSLERIAEFDDCEVLPGHEYRFIGLRARRAEIVGHHLRRTAEVSALAQSLGDAPVWAYAQRLTWTAGWSGLTGFSLHSALRQTEMHLALVRSGRGAELLARYAVNRAG